MSKSCPENWTPPFAQLLSRRVLSRTPGPVGQYASVSIASEPCPSYTENLYENLRISVELGVSLTRQAGEPETEQRKMAVKMLSRELYGDLVSRLMDVQDQLYSDGVRSPAFESLGNIIQGLIDPQPR